MSAIEFKEQLAQLTAQIAGKPLDEALDNWLNKEHGVGSRTYAQLKASCETGVAEGWLCDREGGGIRYGRIFKPTPELNGFSVDVVDMQDIAGPHHAHPLGEIDLIMPMGDDAPVGKDDHVGGNAQFDGRPAGWLVYAPGTAHRPTVSQGRALVLYLLPEGRIEFTR